MSDNSSSLEQRLHMLEPQVMPVEDFEADGWILDIGGGGEGVIGQLKGSQVIAIDHLKGELVEAPDGPVKLVMDARALALSSATYETATAFFSFLYLRTEADVEAVLSELYRVLRPGGRLRIWDMDMPDRPADKMKDLIGIELRIQLPQREISTTYGSRWYTPPRSLVTIVALAESLGFEVGEQYRAASTYKLTLRKPA